MNISIIITKFLNFLLLLIGFFTFSILSQKWRYQYYQWAGMIYPPIKKILFKKLIRK